MTNQPQNLLDDWLFILKRIGPADTRKLATERYMTREATAAAMLKLAKSGYTQQVGLTSKWSLTKKGRERVAWLRFETAEKE